MGDHLFRMPMEVGAPADRYFDLGCRSDLVLKKVGRNLFFEYSKIDSVKASNEQT